MKAVFGCLLCLLLSSAQCFAVKGGPQYPLGNNVVGTYAGVMQGAFDPTNPGSSNTIGIFSLGVPGSGVSGGAFVMFSRGRVFSGSIQGFADPEKATLKGILSASFEYSIAVAVPGQNGSINIQNIEVTATANGPINADIANSRRASTFGGSVTRLRGEATLSISQGTLEDNLDPTIDRLLSLVVSGIKQTNSVTVAVPITVGR